MSTIIAGTTLTHFAMDQPETYASWLRHAERQQAMAAEFGHELRHFAAIETDARGLESFQPLIDRLDLLGGEYYTFSLDDGRTEVTMTNRWRHICFGQNLVVDYCQAIADCSHLLFLAADCAAPSNIIPAMLEMDHPLVAPYISTYGLRGEVVTVPRKFTDGTGGLAMHQVPKYSDFHVEDAMASAACLFIARDVFRRIRFRWDLDTGMSDDPCYHHDAKTLLGIPTYVRHDVQARHYPEAVGDYESRGFDTTVVR